MVLSRVAPCRLKVMRYFQDNVPRAGARGPIVMKGRQACSQETTHCETVFNSQNGLNLSEQLTFDHAPRQHLCSIVKKTEYVKQVVLGDDKESFARRVENKEVVAYPGAKTQTEREMYRLHVSTPWLRTRAPRMCFLGCDGDSRNRFRHVYVKLVQLDRNSMLEFTQFHVAAFMRGHRE